MRFVSTHCRQGCVGGANNQVGAFCIWTVVRDVQDVDFVDENITKRTSSRESTRHIKQHIMPLPPHQQQKH